MDMNTRLGFDWMRVAVYAVDDVTGPLNIQIWDITSVKSGGVSS